mmetsp:Transcript_22837/g.41036  ORF Transcript_22837/g.41036 Transcript_22837/m.41036 type:complete len:150 (-) Transcript_22837:1427-1876(-)
MSTHIQLETELPRIDDSNSIAQDISRTGTRFLVLALACVLVVGLFFAFDNPSALATELMSVTDMQLYGINTLEFSMLYTADSVPNIILPFFGGFLIDRFGLRICIPVFSSLILLGVTVFAISASVASYPLALVGRVILGMGTANLVGSR